MTDPIVYAIRGASGADRYRISNRAGTFVREVTETGYLFTRDVGKSGIEPPKALSKFFRTDHLN
jgi:hypothetical protein